MLSITEPAPAPVWLRIVVALFIASIMLALVVYVLWVELGVRREKFAGIARIREDTRLLGIYGEWFNSLSAGDLPPDYFKAILHESDIILDRAKKDQPIYDLIQIRLRGTPYERKLREGQSDKRR
jgi:hypothetical protein